MLPSPHLALKYEVAYYSFTLCTNIYSQFVEFVKALVIMHKIAPKIKCMFNIK